MPIAHWRSTVHGRKRLHCFRFVSHGSRVETRLGAVFVSGIAFLILSLMKIRPWLANSISPSMKHSFACGIGLFLTLIGLYETGIIASSVKGMPASILMVPGTGILRAPDVPLKLGNLHDPQVLLAIFGFLVTVCLLTRRVKGAILIGMVITAVTGFIFGYGKAPEAIFGMPFVPLTTSRQSPSSSTFSAF